MSVEADASRHMPIVAEIIRNALISVTNEMKIDLMRSSYNPIIHEMLDFSVGLFTDKAETLAQAAGLPQFLCDMPNAIRSIVDDIGGLDAIEDGDVYLTNDPYTSSFHLNDVTVVEPMFLDARVVAFAGARAHWHDIGGKSAGGSSDATNVYQEGLFLRSIRVAHRGQLDRNVIRIIEGNSRLPTAVVGDLRAQVAACHTGTRRLRALIDRYGRDVFGTSIELMIRQGEELARAAVAEIPDGEYFAEGFLDNDGVDLSRRLNVAVTVRVSGDEIEFDLTGTDGAALGPLNANRNITESELRLAFKTADALARGVIADAGYSDHFGHGLGHGIGRDVHEAPIVSAISTSTLEVGNVVTIEPGIYLSGLGGVRVEDLCVVRADGLESQTTLPKRIAL